MNNSMSGQLSYNRVAQRAVIQPKEKNATQQVQGALVGYTQEIRYKSIRAEDKM